MTNSTILKRPLAAVILLGTLALGGCSGTNVGSSWQCPLARGGTCDSVAAADPAVPQAASVPQAARSRRSRRSRRRCRTPGRRGSRCCASRSTGCAPAAGPSRRPSPAKPVAASIPSPGWRGCSADREDSASPKPAPERNPLEAALQTMTGPVGESGDQSGDQPVDAASVPAAPDPGAGEPAVAEPVASSSGESLRSEEVVARIWIAPFVDAGGVYREASHVRVVLEPAGWRVP